MGFFDFIRSVGSWVKDKAQKAFGFAKKVSDGVKTVWNKATSIPVIGNVIRGVGEAVKQVRIPGTPVSIGQALNVADKVIDTGDRVLNR